MTTPAILDETPDFSLVVGGPIYQFFRRAHLSGPTLELQRRRVLFFSLLTWLPLLLIMPLEEVATRIFKIIF